jgi:L-alanine-DL-glutamate epimerase-like enolase superfamily enzyme
MHLIASLPNGGLLEFDQNPNPLRSDLLEVPLTVDGNGRLRLPDGPGLGVRLSESALQKYAYVA